jgi:hypothetical protein
MPKFRIYYTVPYILDVDAKDKDEALDIANETDLGEFEHDTANGDYEIETLEPVKQEQ